MQPDEFVEDIRASWQVQPPALEALTSSLLRRTARVHAWRYRLVGLINLVMLAPFGLLCAAVAWVTESRLSQIGCALMGAGYLYTCFRSWRDTWLPAAPADTGLVSCIAFYRSNLIRRRDAAANVLRLQVLPPAPGVVLAIWGWVLSTPDQRISAAGVCLFWVGMNLAVWRVGQRAAARLQKEIELLDEAEK